MNSAAPKVFAGIALAVGALLAIAYFPGWWPARTPTPLKDGARSSSSNAKAQTATTQSGVVLLPGETLVAPPDPVPAPAPPAAAPPAAKPAPAPSPPRYTKPKPPVVARDTPRPPARSTREERADSYDRSTRSVCMNCGVVTSVARGDYDWEVRVRFDDGRREVLRFYDRPRMEAGDSVHLENGRLMRD